MVEQLNDEFNRAMVVVAHADDAEWGCAGTVARLCAEGWDVAYVICTDGSKGSDDPHMTVETLVKMREEEQRDAARVLGLSRVFFLGYPDAYLESSLQLRRDISRAIRIHRPDVLICMNPVRNLDGNGYIDHPDHFASGDAAMGAVYPAARDRLTFPELLEEGLEPHKVREVWIVGGLEGSNHFVDVDGYLETAIAALKAHRSQVSPEAAEKYFPIGRAETAAKIGLKYAEGFKTIKYH